jgi:hypothetical protein
MKIGPTVCILHPYVGYQNSKHGLDLKKKKACNPLMWFQRGKDKSGEN